MDDLLQEFIAETRETLEALAGEIVGWELDPTDRARLDAIFRFVHTIKGSCGFLDLPRLARLSHAAEDALSAVRAGERAPDAALVSAILAIIDRIGEIVEAIDSGQGLDDSGEEMLIAALDGTPAPAPVPTITPQAVAATPATRAPKRSVRLSVDLLDRMMSGVSDMVLARNQVARQVRTIDDPQLEATLERLSMTVAELRDTVTRTRMQRIEALFSPLPRMVRDTAAALGKAVSLVIEGGDVELDREMIELLRDPLVHMVRNAIDHGIEPKADRILAGKPGTGTLRVAARQAGNLIVIEVADDGCGIDVARLVDKVVRARPGRAADIAGWNDARKAELVFEPGLSSRDEVSAISGRGVGMDVVRANVEQIGGRIALVNAPGRGLVVSIEVPLTLAILNTVIVEAAGTRFAVPRQAIEEIVALDPATMRVDRFGDAAMVTARGRRLSLVELDRLLAMPRVAEPRFLAVLNLREGAFALALTGVDETQELVVKPAAPAVMRAGIYAGQMLPDDGVPILLLDVAGIAARAGLRFERVEEAAAEETQDEGSRALLFRDLDGTRRLIAADAVNRIERVAPGSIARIAGAWWLTRDGEPTRVWTDGSADPAAAPAAIRIALDGQELVYPAEEAVEIVTMPAEITPATHGVVAGIAMLEGEPIEIIDPLRLFDVALRPAERPVCLLHGSEGGWMDAFLRPTIEAAGYRVVRRADAADRIAVALAVEEEAESAPAPVIRLSRRAGTGLYRGDRAALAAALEERSA